MKNSLIAFGLMTVFAVQTAPSSGAVLNYAFSVEITRSSPVNPSGNPFTGHVFTGTFSADTDTGLVTNFAANLLDGSFQAASLSNAAHFDAGGNLTHLTFKSSVEAPDGIRGFGFTDGFTPIQVSVFGLNPSNYFAYLSPSSIIQGGGTPVFTLLGNAVPEPATWAMMVLGFGFAGAALRKGRRMRLAAAA
ncbi:PEPxxWA-CTERM sorting domain-containing protein [Sphingomonas flavalba]|uniref:PEPxxWA-CTERM sorting domain-containing protein n=1 Tax=Sphingomonas flavalba TaxID=2559804 RepID=UPI0039E10172